MIFQALYRDARDNNSGETKTECTQILFVGEKPEDFETLRTLAGLLHSGIDASELRELINRTRESGQ